MQCAGDDTIGLSSYSCPVRKPLESPMIAEKVHPVEDAFHRMQTPMPLSAGHPPTDDEVANALRIELWNAGFRQHEFEVAVSDMGISISGAVSTEALRKKAVDVAHKAAAGRLVVDGSILADAAAASQ